jgi:hypothetical protein
MVWDNKIRSGHICGCKASLETLQVAVRPLLRPRLALFVEGTLEEYDLGMHVYQSKI